jgi:hypothetical protein
MYRKKQSLATFNAKVCTIGGGGFSGSAGAPGALRENLYPENRLSSAKIP